MRGGHAERRVRDEEHPHDAAEPGGQRGDDDERIQPGLEVDDHEQVDEQDGEDQTEAETGEGGVHALHLPAHGDRVAGRQLGSELGYDFLDRRRHAAEVPVLHVGEDVEDRLHVRVADDGRNLASFERGQVAEELLRARRARGDRRVHQRVDGVDPVLGRLHGNEIVDAAAGIGPVVRRHDRARAERDEDAVRHVALGEPQLGGARSVDVDQERVAHACGQIINPDGVRAQIEGQIIQTTSRTLKEELKWDRSRVTSVDWVTYPILKFPEVPEVVMELINRPSEPPWGVGEPAACLPPPAISNAIFDAVGVRLRSVPFTANKVKAGVKV
jgi:hypothetical protein